MEFYKIVKNMRSQLGKIPKENRKKELCRPTMLGPKNNRTTKNNKDLRSLKKNRSINDSIFKILERMSKFKRSNRLKRRSKNR